MLYRYRLHYEDGSDAGEAHYAVGINPGETIWTGDGKFVESNRGDRRPHPSLRPPLIPRNRAVSARDRDEWRTPRRLHTRGVAGSIPAAPTAKRLLIGRFVVRPHLHYDGYATACEIRARFES